MSITRPLVLVVLLAAPLALVFFPVVYSGPIEKTPIIVSPTENSQVTEVVTQKNFMNESGGPLTTRTITLPELTMTYRPSQNPFAGVGVIQTVSILLGLALVVLAAIAMRRRQRKRSP